MLTDFHSATLPTVAIPVLPSDSREDKSPDAVTESSSQPEPQASTTVEPARSISWTEIGRLIAGKLAVKKKLQAAALGASILLVVAMVPVPHRVRCSLTVEPQTRRFLSAPFECTLSKVFVRPGESVTAGQVLARMDDAKLTSELAGLAAQLAQAKQRYTAALSNSDALKAELAKFEATHIQKQIEIAERRQAELVLRSPLDGIVLSGNLERAQGSTFKAGDILFEIGPLNLLVAELAIAESDIRFINRGAVARVALDGLPEFHKELPIQQIHPRAELIDTELVYIGEAAFENQDSHVRPGMKGTAYVHQGLQPLAWVLFHRPYESLRSSVGWE